MDPGSTGSVRVQKGRALAAAESLPAPPYGPAGPWPWISPPYLPGSSRNPTYFFLYLCAFLSLHLSHSLFFSLLHIMFLHPLTFKPKCISIYAYVHACAHAFFFSVLVWESDTSWSCELLPWHSLSPCAHLSSLADGWFGRFVYVVILCSMLSDI